MTSKSEDDPLSDEITNKVRFVKDVFSVILDQGDRFFILTRGFPLFA